MTLHFFNYVIVDRLPSGGLLMIASRMIARVAQQIHDIDIGFFVRRNRQRQPGKVAHQVGSGAINSNNMQSSEEKNLNTVETRCL